MVSLMYLRLCSECEVPKIRLDLLQQKSLMKLAVRLLCNYNLPEGWSAVVFWFSDVYTFL